MFLDGQMREEGIDLRFRHLFGVAHFVEVDKPFDPMAISLSGSPAVIARVAPHIIGQGAWAGVRFALDLR